MNECNIRLCFVRAYITIEQSPSASFVLTIKKLDCQASTHCQEAFFSDWQFPHGDGDRHGIHRAYFGDGTNTYLIPLLILNGRRPGQIDEGCDRAISESMCKTLACTIGRRKRSSQKLCMSSMESFEHVRLVRLAVPR